MLSVTHYVCKVKQIGAYVYIYYFNRLGVDEFLERATFVEYDKPMDGSAPAQESYFLPHKSTIKRMTSYVGHFYQFQQANYRMTSSDIGAGWDDDCL
jgi:hypothetical protein